MQQLKPIMFVGTCSDAGKSIVNTAFCRIFKQDGFHPAPFKAQNMSLNSFSTQEGGEMGRAQVVQAEACGLLPHTDMNPILLKPTTHQTSQVIVNGKVTGNFSAKTYFSMKEKKEVLFKEATAAFRRLASHYSPVVLEGAGSISELNLKERDICNMRMALYAKADTYLVADIDRGGIFGSVYGTIQLLPPEERALMKGIIINKFRGDISLFEQGKKMLEELTHIPVIGVLPWFDDIKIEAEDSVALDMKTNGYHSGKINIAVIKLRHISNFTDFDVLEKDPRFNTYYTDQPEEISKANIIILPGSKNTIADLEILKGKGLDKIIKNASEIGRTVIGICGGYQMMGQVIEDPEQIEGEVVSVKGLGLLPTQTIITNEKITRQVRFGFLNSQQMNCIGYEIHMGRTTIPSSIEYQPIAFLENETKDGIFINNHCWGCYIHGIFDNQAVLDYLVTEFDNNRHDSFNYQAFKEQQYDRLADLVRQHIDMEYIYRSLRKN